MRESITNKFAPQEKVKRNSFMQKEDNARWNSHVHKEINSTGHINIWINIEGISTQLITPKDNYETENNGNEFEGL